MISRRRLEFIQNFIFLALTIIPINEFFPFIGDSKTIKFLAVICIISYITILILKLNLYDKNKITKITEGSGLFFSFLTKWFSKPGKLIIITPDLKWMIDSQYDLINILCQKGDACTVFVNGNVDNRTKKRLEDNKVQIYENKDLEISDRIFILKNERAAKIFICEKIGGTEFDKVIFIMEDNNSNPYFVSFIVDLLTSNERLLASINNMEKKLETETGKVIPFKQHMERKNDHPDLFGSVG